MNRLIKAKLSLADGDHLYATKKVDDASGQWVRKIESLSPLKRTVSLDRTFERGGFTLSVNDIDGALKTMLSSDTNRKINGKTVTLYIYKPDGVTLADTVVATISDWKRDGGNVVFTCAQDLFGAMNAIPGAQALVINATDFPDVGTYYPRTLGKPVQFPTGVCDSRWGKIACWKVVKRNVGLAIDAKYLITKSDPAGAPRITSINDVFENGARVSSGGSNYTLLRDVNGWEYVNYNGAEQKIRVNVIAVSAPGTAGANPVDALRGVLAAANVTLVDNGSGGASDFKNFCTAQTWAMGGVPEGAPTTKDYIETWCQEFNCFWRQASAGVVHIKHFDWASIVADATLTERHFSSLAEATDMSKFANRLRSKTDYGNAKFSSEIVTDSIDGDCLPATKTVEKTETYLLAAFGGTPPYAEKLRWYDRTPQWLDGVIDLEQYDLFGLGLLKVAHITHSRQLGAAGKYLVMEEEIDYIGGTVKVKLFRLWGV